MVGKQGGGKINSIYNTQNAMYNQEKFTSKRNVCIIVSKIVCNSSNLFMFDVTGLNVIVESKNYKLQIGFRKLVPTFRISCRYCCTSFELRDKDFF